MAERPEEEGLYQGNGGQLMINPKSKYYKIQNKSQIQNPKLFWILKFGFVL